MVRVLIRGTDDVASALALRLFEAGMGVAIAADEAPDDCHRLFALTDAVFDGTATLLGVTAVRVDAITDLLPLLERHESIPLSTFQLTVILDCAQPDVLIDARLRKRELPERQIGRAPLTIGLGPNFIAGETVDLICETGFGDDMGRVSAHGSTRPPAGEPLAIGGHARDRLVYAPVAGTFRTDRRLGDPLRAGDVAGTLNGEPIRVPFDGALRGLVHDGVFVPAGGRLLDVDPRGPEFVLPAISGRSHRIAESILDAVQRWHADRSQAAASAGE